MTPEQRRRKTEWQRRKRAEAAIAAGREPGRTGRPATGRKAPKHHGDRVGQRRRRREREVVASGDNGWTESKHPLMDEAAAVARQYVHPDGRTMYNDQKWEEGLSAAALALLEGTDPHEAVKATVRQWNDWAAHNVTLEAYNDDGWD